MSDYALPTAFTRLTANTADELIAPVNAAAREERLVVQQCADCGTFQSPPEHLCNACLSENLAFVAREPHGTVYSWVRVWHPVNDALIDAGPYVVLLVALQETGNVRVIGNLVGDPGQDVVIGAVVRAVFEHHDDFSLIQWALA